MNEVDSKEIYKAVRNVIFNELGITRSEVDAIIHEQVKDRIDHFFKNTSLERMVLETVKTGYRDGNLRLSDDYYSGTSMREHIEEIIANEFSSQIQRQVAEVLSQIVISPKLKE